MAWLSFAQLDAASAALDALAARTPEIDGFCSCSHWILPARQAFAPDTEPLILRTDDGFVCLMTLPTPAGLSALPLEASWGLASPLVGLAPERLVEQFFDALPGAPVRRPIHGIAFSGVATHGRAIAAVQRAPIRRAHLVEDTRMVRVVASLDGGVDGFLARRSPKFRASARRARRAAAAAGITYERLPQVDAGAVAALWARIQAVERRCWKAADGSGIHEGPMHVFYEEMLPRLARAGLLRVVFVRRDGLDLAYCFGAVFPSEVEGHPRGLVYRGLQVSFDDAYARESPGVLAHLEMIDLLCAEGVIAYDLGSDMEYKRRWGELGLETITCLALR